MRIILARRRLLPRFWKLPQICLPRCRMRVDFPKQLPPPWQQIEVEKVIFAPLKKPDMFIVRVIFA